MSEEPRFASVGWKFLGVAWLICLVPTYYFVFSVTMDNTPAALRLGSIAFMAGFVAAIITWIVNTLLGYIAGRGNSEITDTDED